MDNVHHNNKPVVAEFEQPQVLSQQNENLCDETLNLNSSRKDYMKHFLKKILSFRAIQILSDGDYKPIFFFDKMSEMFTCNLCGTAQNNKQIFTHFCSTLHVGNVHQYKIANKNQINDKIAQYIHLTGIKRPMKKIFIYQLKELLDVNLLRLKNGLEKPCSSIWYIQKCSQFLDITSKRLSIKKLTQKEWICIWSRHLKCMIKQEVAVTIRKLCQSLHINKYPFIAQKLVSKFHESVERYISLFISNISKAQIDVKTNKLEDVKTNKLKGVNPAEVNKQLEEKKFTIQTNHMEKDTKQISSESNGVLKDAENNLEQKHEKVDLFQQGRKNVCFKFNKSLATPNKSRKDAVNENDESSNYLQFVDDEEYVDLTENKEDMIERNTNNNECFKIETTVNDNVCVKIETAVNNNECVKIETAVNAPLLFLEDDDNIFRSTFAPELNDFNEAKIHEMSKSYETNPAYSALEFIDSDEEDIYNNIIINSSLHQNNLERVDSDDDENMYKDKLPNYDGIILASSKKLGKNKSLKLSEKDVELIVSDDDSSTYSEHCNSNNKRLLKKSAVTKNCDSNQSNLHKRIKLNLINKTMNNKRKKRLSENILLEPIDSDDNSNTYNEQNTKHQEINKGDENLTVFETIDSDDDDDSDVYYEQQKPLHFLEEIVSDDDMCVPSEFLNNQKETVNKTRPVKHKLIESNFRTEKLSEKPEECNTSYCLMFADDDY